ncbi:hypothetical protein UFOVP652_34 [uncultured Caudovirales phage]|uniref:Uncharacterized protein n=1 Tax=uncultured Caudovirales phage TaxID=2100421 RepID=A0A6J5NCB9_9CAUD|nr:hypothetical protein UFOVP652_34 [uncultured Caudovirales phage]CAB5223796.1 hypothetical protein UFOVP734_5 [uncultured Caudovirales phage]
MTEISATCCGIPCIIRVTNWEGYVPAFICADPGHSSPAEGGYGDWEILDRNGRPAAWLESKMDLQERARIEHTIFNHMENIDDY